MARMVAAYDQPDDLPEADRLADFPHPRHTETVFGHDQPWQAFHAAADSGRLHHAWLLSGPAGIGKATFAYQAARLLLEQGGAGDLGGEQSARLVSNLSHPRLCLLRRPYDPKTKKFAAFIPVDEVRKLRPFVGKTADSDAWRVVIIDHVNDLNNASANALLKVLEEPPRQTVFFLIAPQPGALLATIRSRCRTLPLETLRGSAFAHAVNQALAAREDKTEDSLTISQCEHLEQISGGSVGRALVLSDHDNTVLIEQIDAALKQLPEVNWPKVRALAEDVSGVGQDVRFRLATDVVLDRVAQLTKARTTGVGRPDIVTLAERLIDPDAVASWAELWERGVRDRAETLSLNLDRKALILGLFSHLSQAVKASQ